MGMKIENKLVDKKVSFKTLKVGDFFLDEDGDLCVCIPNPYASENAFCFPCNLLLEKDAGEPVTPVDVTITIDGYAS